MESQLKTYDVTFTATVRVKAKNVQDAISTVHDRYTYLDNGAFDPITPPHVETTKIDRVTAD